MRRPPLHPAHVAPCSGHTPFHRPRPLAVSLLASLGVLSTSACAPAGPAAPTAVEAAAHVIANALPTTNDTAAVRRVIHAHRALDSLVIESDVHGDTLSLRLRSARDHHDCEIRRVGALDPLVLCDLPAAPTSTPRDLDTELDPVLLLAPDGPMPPSLGWNPRPRANSIAGRAWFRRAPDAWLGAVGGTPALLARRGGPQGALAIAVHVTSEAEAASVLAMLATAAERALGRSPVHVSLDSTASSHDRTPIVPIDAERATLAWRVSDQTGMLWLALPPTAVLAHGRWVVLGIRHAAFRPSRFLTTADAFARSAWALARDASGSSDASTPGDLDEILSLALRLADDLGPGMTGTVARDSQAVPQTVAGRVE